MGEEEWEEFLGLLDQAEASLRGAFTLMDGIEGFTEAGEHAWSAALAAINTIRAAEVASRKQRQRAAAARRIELSDEQVAFIDESLDYSAQRFRDEPYLGQDAEWAAKQREEKLDTIDEIKAALRRAKPDDVG